MITQAKAAGKRMIFYGDDTWVKLFPKHFVEYDGTTSFFVSDYTEVSFPSKKHVAWEWVQDPARSVRRRPRRSVWGVCLCAGSSVETPSALSVPVITHNLGARALTGVRRLSGAPGLEQPSTLGGARRVRKGFPAQSHVNQVLTGERGLPTWTGWGGSLCPRQSPRVRVLPGSSRLLLL